MDALVLLLAMPTMGAPPKLWPLLPKVLVPELLPKGLVPVPLPVPLLKGLEVPGLDVPEVPAVPEESVPVPVVVVGLLENDDPPSGDALPKGVDPTPDVVPGARFPVVAARLLLCSGWPKRPMGLILASPR